MCYQALLLAEKPIHGIYRSHSPSTSSHEANGLVGAEPANPQELELDLPAFAEERFEFTRPASRTEAG